MLSISFYRYFRRGRFLIDVHINGRNCRTMYVKENFQLVREFSSVTEDRCEVGSGDGWVSPFALYLICSTWRPTSVDTLYGQDP